MINKFKHLYPIDATGDAVIGDRVIFQKAIFIGRYPYGYFSHYEIIEAEILKDSYGEKKQQHTFTLKDINTNTIFKIKGRNLYRNGLYRKPWKDEQQRLIAQKEKHCRGNEARKIRDHRKDRKES